MENQNSKLAFSHLGSINLRVRIQQAGITNAILAEEIGVSRSTVSQWCSLRRVPNKHRTAVIEALGKAREARPPRVKVRKKAKLAPTVRSSSVKFTEGYNYALNTVSNLLEVPTDSETKLKLIKTLADAGETARSK